MRTHISLVLIGMLVVAGCHEETESGAEVVIDVGSPEDTSDTVDFDGIQSDDTGDTSEDVEDTGVGDVDSGAPDTGPVCPGGFECPCEENADCDSGLCVEGPGGGSICTDVCVDQCPEGYLCKQWNVGGDPVFICQPELDTLCKPCTDDSECENGLCIADDSGAGRCATSCDPEDETGCPGGFTCDAIEVDGETVNQCIHESGSCPCSDALVGVARPCTTDNEFGSCTGTQLCTTDGWAECDAATPAEELCDGIDNDCDEETDETFPDLATACDTDDEDLCANGQISCADDGLTTICAEDSPAVEQCDGVDNNCNDTIDEGFPNTDSDALADCVDDDDDNDGDPDVSDCEPTNADIFSSQSELCDGIDQNCNGETDEGFPNLDGDELADCIDDDDDGDGFPDLVDNCPTVANPDQSNIDSDPQGDACDDDDDGDNVPDATDVCPTLFDPLQEDADLDNLGDVCDPDDDNDGTPDGQDCQPFDGTVFPGAPELCDGKDNNCNGPADEGFLDSDGDLLSDCLDDDDDNDFVPDTADCAPLNPAIFPGADEVCNDVDDDCDQQTDEGFDDIDDDGQADCVDSDDDGDGVPDGFDNCPSQPNPSQTNSDGDLAGDACDTDDDGDGSLDPDDCAPKDPTINPGASEQCNGVDDNCNGITDEGFTDADGDLTADCVDPDDDGDTVPDAFDNCPTVPNTSQLNSDADLLGNACDLDDDNDTAPDAIDCAPTDNTISPYVTEVCDGIDNNCANGADEGFPDSNNDGIADCATDDNDGDGVPDTADNCPTIPNPNQQNADSDLLGDACDLDDDNDTAPDSIDCAPTDDSISPYVPEACDGIDNNCNNQTDEGFTNSDNDAEADCIDIDDDSDGIPDTLDNCPTIANPTQENSDTDLLGDACDTDDDNDGSPDALDCAPTNPAISPSAPEQCDGIDNNCSGDADEIFPDTNGDGEADCIDNDDDGDGVVDSLDNCPNVANEGQENSDTDLLGNACDADDDNDGDLDFSDCAPTNPAISANATEVCDGVDNNCQGGVDEGFPDTNDDGQADCVDNDDDGDGILDASDNCPLVPNPSQINSDNDLLGDACDNDDDNDLDLDSSDCAPTDPSINNQAAEVCDGIDNNCQGGTDEGFTNTDNDALADCVDDDDDNDGDPDATDCAPTNAAVSNLATEICGNNLDDDCDTDTNCFTVQQGNTTATANPTQGTESAVAYYQYDTPDNASANTGLETNNRALEFIYEDPTDGAYYLMIVLDAPDNSGGNANITITGAVGASVVIMDDPGEGNPFIDPITGAGTLQWNWAPCCTDGALIGPLAPPFCVTMTWNSWSGINGVTTYSDGLPVPLGGPGEPLTLCANP